MRLADIPTPALVLDRRVLLRNIAAMHRAVSRHGVALRPHMKTAKSIDVARLALGATSTGIAVSTLAEAEYFLGHDLPDMIYTVGITPQKLDQVGKLNAAGAAIMVVTDDVGCAAAIAAHPTAPRTLIEIDTGEGRGGVAADDPQLEELAARLGPLLAGVMTHGGHSYAGRGAADMARIAEAERSGVAAAAARLTAAGHPMRIVSMGSSPTALHTASLAGVTELRAGVYMFGDLFQAEIGTHGDSDLALTVLASVIGRKPGSVLLDAGAIALSKDRSTAATTRDRGYGLMLDLAGQRSYGTAILLQAWQEHSLVELDPDAHAPQLAVGARVRIAPNHACLTAAAHDRYFVVEDGDAVVAVWPRVGGW